LLQVVSDVDLFQELGSLGDRNLEIDLPKISSLVLPLSVPRIQHVFTVDLQLFSALKSKQAKVETVAVEELINAELKITLLAASSSGNRPSTSKTCEAVFEVQANPDVWIVGGPRQMRYIATVSVPHHDSTQSLLV
jgi:hypothetical protein